MLRVRNGRMDRTTRNGLILGIGAYVSWGLLPLYLKLLVTVPPVQVLAHRVLWSLILLVVVVAALRRARGVWTAARGRTLLLLCGSATLIAGNWLVYIWATQHGHVLEASLGYFINPLLNVVLGVALLGERVRPVQAVAVGIAAVGVVVMAVGGAAQIGIPLALAFTFGFYGLIRKVAAIDALGGLTVETALLALPALAVLGQASAAGTAAWGASGRLDLLLVLAGAVTAAPLLMFAAAAKRLRFTTIGLLQYIGPTIQFALAVLVFGEALQTYHLVTFALIWAGCLLYALDSLRAARMPVPPE
jgi:chloramphenicol-sensitive protein RarD